jgi:hypothetical protein
MARDDPAGCLLRREFDRHIAIIITEQQVHRNGHPLDKERVRRGIAGIRVHAGMQFIRSNDGMTRKAGDGPSTYACIGTPDALRRTQGCAPCRSHPA